MNAKRTIKKILALGAGVTMVGATIMGAMAYDLATYPAPFIKAGVFDGEIVLGSTAKMEDLIGAVDISTSLQALAVSKKPVDIPGVTGQVSLSGDSFRLESGSDKVGLREPIGDVVDTITSTDLKGLKSGHLSTSQGDTDYNQYIRLKDVGLQTMAVNYVADDENDIVADYLIVQPDDPFFQWEIQFPEGFESERVDTVGADNFNSLRDFEDRTLNIMGQDFTIVRSTVTAGGAFEVLLMGGSAPLTLKEGETKTITLNGVDHEVTLLFVSNPAGGGTVSAKFMVDSQQTRALESGDTETLSGGLQIGIRDILVNNQGGVASFFLGAHKVVMTDANATNGAGNFDGNIKVDQDSISDGQVEVLGSFTDGTSAFKISSIKYQLTMDAQATSTAYVPAGKGLRELMRRPQSLISDSFDMKYMGLEDVQTKDVAIKPMGDDRYRMTFTNIDGQTYTFPLLSNRDGVWKFGDNNDDLIFVEGTSATNYIISRNDYFVVSNDRGTDSDKSVSNVLRYRAYDKVTQTAEFTDLASDAVIKTVMTGTTTGVGDLIIGGHTFKVYADNVSLSEPLLAVDLNADLGWTDKIPVTTWGGAVVGLADATGGNASAGTAFVNESIKVLSKNFDSDPTGLGEQLIWTISQAASNQIDLSTGSSGYFGPLAVENASSEEWNKFELTDKDGNSDHKIGMTDWGIFVDHLQPTGSNDADTLTLSVPRTQRYAQVFLTMGATTSSAGGAVTADSVNPISVGLAVLDKDAAAIGTRNQIVVGGPCVNTVAAALMGTGTGDCTAGFTAGKALIKSFDNNGKIAILVAGYDAQDTQGASRALANYKDYAADFKGSEVEVVVPSLSAIKVQAVTPLAPTNTT